MLRIRSIRETCLAETREMLINVCGESKADKVDIIDTIGTTATTRKSEEREVFLSRAASRYIWWETVDSALVYPQKILAQVMNIGTWDDMCKLVELFPAKDLLDILNTSYIGQFNERSWRFWHNRFSKEIPPMPKRVLQ